MKKILLIAILLMCCSLIYCQIKPIENPTKTDKTPIENIEAEPLDVNTDIQRIEDIPENQISDTEFNSIPINKEYAGEEEYRNEFDSLIKQYGYENDPKILDKFYDPHDIYRPSYGQFKVNSSVMTLTQMGLISDKDIEVEYDYRYMKAKDFTYFQSDGQYFGQAKDIMYTNCENHEHPHWSIIAKDITFYNSDTQIHTHLKNVGFKIGKWQLVWLPFYTHTINKNNPQSTQYLLIPLITYNKSNGIGFKYKPTLFENDRFVADADIRWSKKKNWNYKINAQYALDRDFGINPFITGISMNSMIDRVNDLGRTSLYKNGLTEENIKKRAHLTLSANSIWKDTDTTMDGEDVDIYKTIESTLRYSFNPFGHRDRLSIYSLIAPSVSFTYTREKDEPVLDAYYNKYKFSALVPYALGKYKGIDIQPFVKFTYTNYKNFSTYKSFSGGLDLSKYYDDDSYWNIRYIQGTDSGYPLFEFDSINYERGIMASGVKNINNRYMLGGWFAHNFNTEKSYKYGIMIGIKEDCFWASIGYDIKKHEIITRLAILGF